MESFICRKLRQLKDLSVSSVRNVGVMGSFTVEMAAAVAGRVSAAEIIETVRRWSDLGGAALVFAFEGVIFVWNLCNAYKCRRDGQLTLKAFTEKVASDATLSVVRAGFTIAGDLAGEYLSAKAGAVAGSAIGSVVPGVGTAIGAAAGTCIGVVIGTIAGGVVGGMLGNALGRGLLGPAIGKAISATIKCDDRRVKRLLDLNPGDHVVFFAHALHPRCHAIVVNPASPTEVEIIRNTWKQGVVKEIIAYDPIKQPLYRVDYGSAEIYSVEEILTRAESRLSDKSYSIATYNCKDFAYWCKLQTYFGTGWLAPSVGMVISATLKSRDVPVQSTLDLYTGDHIVFCAHYLHPQCHAIVINPLSQTDVEVIRNTWQRGVVREVVTHRSGSPLYMINYKDEKMRRPRVVLERAFSRLGEKKYSILFNNCKTFAYWCKWRKN